MKDAQIRSSCWRRSSSPSAAILFRAASSGLCAAFVNACPSALSTVVASASIMNMGM